MEGVTNRAIIDVLLNLRQPTIRVPLHVSPDGAKLAISVQSKRRGSAVSADCGFTDEGVPTEMVGSRVLVVDTATGAIAEPFPAPAMLSWGAQWSPDGNLLAAYVQQDGRPCLGIWQRDTGAVTFFHQAPVRPFFGFEVPQWTPDSRAVIVKLLLDRPGADVDHQGHSSEDAVRVTAFSFDPDAQTAITPLPGWVDSYRCDLARVDVATGEVQRLARDWCLTGWKVAPDGSAVAVLRDVGADQTRQQSYFDLAIVPFEGNAPRVIASRIPQEYGICFNWSPDSCHIAYTTAERGHTGHLFVVPADGAHEPRDLTAGDQMDVAQDYEAPRWNTASDRIYCLAAQGFWEVAADGSAHRRVPADLGREILGWVQRPASATVWMPADHSVWEVVRDPDTHNTGLAQVEIETGRSTPLTEVARGWVDRIFGVEVAPDGSAVYLLLEAADHPPEIWHLRNGLHEPQRLCSLNPALAEVTLGTSRLVEWRAADGETRQGALLLPPRYNAGHRLPVIVSVYGGAFGSHLLHRFGGDEGILHAQVLVSRGYAVFFPDLPLEDRDPLRQLAGQVLPAVNRLVDLGIADPIRIGLMGHSYGGYCVLALLTQTTRFRATVCCAGAVNLTSHYGALTSAGDSGWLGWAETGQGRMGGSLWDKRDAYIENSPLFYLDRVRTPLLVVSGTALPGEAAQAGETFSALRRLGKRVEVRLYEGEDHWPGFWSEPSIRDLWHSVLRWFDACFTK